MSSKSCTGLASHTCLSRRRLFFVGGHSLGLGMLAALSGPRLAMADEQSEWVAQRKRLSGTQPGSGVLRELQGQLEVNGSPVNVGARVHSGDLLSTAPQSRAILSLEDGSAVHLRGATRFVFQIHPQRRESWFRLLSGAVLAVIPKGQRHLAEGSTALIGVKGTVYYRERFPADVRNALSLPHGHTVALPPGADEFLCLCNGEMDYLSPDLRPQLNVRSVHHQAALLSQATREKPQERVPVQGWLNHTDLEIRALVGWQDTRRHPIDWLEDRR